MVHSSVTRRQQLKFLSYILFFVHLMLGLWSLGGFFEMIFEHVPWTPFTNPLFPNWLLLIHWGSILFASTIFCFGLMTHWSRTPSFMLLAYLLMALVCVIETFGYMTNESKYFAMTAEFIAYISILLLLFKSNYFTEYFN